MKRLTALAVSVLALAAISVASPAKANTYTYDGYNLVGGVSVAVSSPINQTVGAGEIVLHGSGADLGNNLSVWCVDLLDNLQTGPYTYQIDQLTAAGVGQGNPLLTLAKISVIGSLIEGGLGVAPADPLRFAAVQLAIWRTLYSTLATPSISAPLDALTALLLIDAAVGGSIHDPNVEVFYLHDAPSAPNQVLGFAVTTQTPLPAAGWMFASGLAGLGLLARRRRGQRRLAI